MPRFNDQWVVDKTMFEFISGGDCQCCGFSHLLFNPDGLKGLISAVSDIDTDAAKEELSAAEKSPWPPDMRDQIWADRVKLRLKMKREMKGYREFFKKFDREEVSRWCREDLGVDGMRKLLQLPRSELMETVKSKYGICSAYAVVLCTVVEQVAHFKLTKYETDGRGLAEIAFEERLTFGRMGGFTLPIRNNEKGISEEVLSVFMNMMMSLQGPKLLTRGKIVSDNGEDNDEVGGADDVDEVSKNNGSCPSFCPDRRILRLLIARYWADRLIKKFNEMNAKEESERDGQIS